MFLKFINTVKRSVFLIYYYSLTQKSQTSCRPHATCWSLLVCCEAHDNSPLRYCFLSFFIHLHCVHLARHVEQFVIIHPSLPFVADFWVPLSFSHCLVAHATSFSSVVLACAAPALRLTCSAEVGTVGDKESLHHINGGEAKPGAERKKWSHTSHGLGKKTVAL